MNEIEHLNSSNKKLMQAISSINRYCKMQKICTCTFSDLLFILNDCIKINGKIKAIVDGRKINE